jgi:glycerophosphoryl diester phosphodiesterase
MASPAPLTRVEYIAHRGAKREHVENTLPAFARALELGADGVELDVHRTRDGVIVVHHDFELSAATDEATLLELSALAWNDVRRIDLGGGVTVPTLHEVMELLAGRAVAYVEIKGRGIAADVVAALARHQGPYAVHSFDHSAIAEVAHSSPGVRRGVLFDAVPASLEATIGRTGAADVWPRWDLVDQSLVDRAARAGARVIAWTVNDGATASRLIRLGVQGLCGDDLRNFPQRAVG